MSNGLTEVKPLARLQKKDQGFGDSRKESYTIWSRGNLEIFNLNPTQPRPQQIVFTLPLASINKEIFELLDWAGKSNWDKEGADPVTIETVNFAHEIIKKILEEVGRPEISPDPEGRIDFDWDLDNGTMFTISVGNKRDLVVSGLRDGISELSGTELWYDDEKSYSLLKCGLEWFKKVQDE